MAIEICSLLIGILALVIALAINSSTNKTLQKVNSILATMPEARQVERALEDAHRSGSRRVSVTAAGGHAAHLAFEIHIPSKGSDLSRQERLRHRISCAFDQLGGWLSDPLAAARITPWRLDHWDARPGGAFFSSGLSNLTRDGWEPMGVDSGGTVWVRRPLYVATETGPQDNKSASKTKTVTGVKSSPEGIQLAFGSLGASYVFGGLTSGVTWLSTIVALSLATFAFFALLAVRWPFILSWLKARESWTNVLKLLLWTTTVYGLVVEVLRSVSSAALPLPHQAIVMWWYFIVFVVLFAGLVLRELHKRPQGVLTASLALGAMILSMGLTDVLVSHALLPWFSGLLIVVGLTLFVIRGLKTVRGRREPLAMN